MPPFMSIFGEMQLVPSIRRLEVEQTRPVMFSNAKMPSLLDRQDPSRIVRVYVCANSARH